MKELTTEEQDKLCRDKGWPTVTEQQRYWLEHPTIDERIKALEGHVMTLAELTRKIADQLRQHQESMVRLIEVIKEMQNEMRIVKVRTQPHDQERDDTY